MCQVSYLIGSNEFVFEVSCLNGMQFAQYWISAPMQLISREEREERRRRGDCTKTVIKIQSRSNFANA